MLPLLARLRQNCQAVYGVVYFGKYLKGEIFNSTLLTTPSYISGSYLLFVSYFQKYLDPDINSRGTTKHQ